MSEDNSHQEVKKIKQWISVCDKKQEKQRNEQTGQRNEQKTKTKTQIPNTNSFCLCIPVKQRVQSASPDIIDVSFCFPQSCLFKNSFPSLFFPFRLRIEFLRFGLGISHVLYQVSKEMNEKCTHK